MPLGQSDLPRKAYYVELHAVAVKTAIVWGTSYADAKRRYYEEQEENVLVMDNDFHERGLRNVRRMPSEDRDA